MQPLGIVDLFDEPGQSLGDVWEGFVAGRIDRAPGLVYPILNIEVLSASFRRSIFSPGLVAPGITALPFEKGSGSRHSVILLPRHHRPNDAGHLAG